jgi:hypothetical protein
VAARIHTALTIVFVAAVPLVPLGMWVYAKAASVDRGAQVARAKELLAQAPPPPGSRNLGFSVYSERKWDGDNLVPIASYQVETAYKLPHRFKTREVTSHYRRELRGWVADLSPDGTIEFRRGGDSIAIDTYEYLETNGGLKEFGVIVSQ